MGSDILKLFINRLEDLGAKTYICHSLEDLLQHINDLIKEVKTQILITGSETEYKKQLIERLKENNQNIQVIRVDSTIPVCDAELSIGFPELALANTGTVIYRASSGIEEASIYFPEIHISIISRNKILYDIEDLEGYVDDFLRRGESLYFITGPSSTADIEGEIVKGVHGPRRFYVFIIDGESL